MALLTELTFQEAAGLLAAYGLKLERLTPLSAGSVNSNFFLETEGGRRLFGRLYEEQGPGGAEFEVRLNQALAASGVPVAAPLLTTAGAPFAIYQQVPALEKPFSLYEYVKGEIVCHKLVTPALAHSVGQALASVHRAALGDLALPEGRFTLEALGARLQRVRASGRSSLSSDVELLDGLIQQISRERDPSLPTGLIHGDLFRDNVLVEGDRVKALLDFESACRGPFVYDLIVTILAFCFGDDLRLDLTKAMVLGYHGTRALESRELRALETEARLACVRFAITRLTDFSLRVPEGEAPVRDYRRFLERMRAVDAGHLRQAFEVAVVL